MSARSAIYKLLSEDPQLSELGFGSVYGAGSVDTPGEDRFVVIRAQDPEARAYGWRSADRFLVWFHDRDQDYGQIDLAIERLKEILRDAVHVSGGDGWVLTQAHWNSNGPDLYDDGYKTSVRWADITANSRYDTAN